MRRGRGVRICLCNLLVLALLTALAWGAWHGEWWYPALASAKRYPALDLKQSGRETEEHALHALSERADVTLTDLALLVNAEHPLPQGYTPELVEYNGARMHPLMLESYKALRDDVQARTGVRIYVASDYRTAEEQAAILQEQGSATAAAVGCSEHEAGFALDVYAPYCGGINFLRSPAGRMVNNLCGEYGYILRYPYQREHITGIAYEPWHIRYVGQPHAKLMMDHGLTLEEYYQALESGTWYEYGSYAFAKIPQDAQTVSLPRGWTQCEISPDNMGNYIITLAF